MNAGPALVKLTTIFANSTSSRRMAANPQRHVRRHERLCPLNVDSSRRSNVSNAHLAVIAKRLGERVKSTLCCEFRRIPATDSDLMSGRCSDLKPATISI